MNRRGVLRLIGISPVAAPLAAKEAVSGMAITNQAATGGNWDCPEPPNPALESLINKVSRATNHPHDFHISVPPHIESMKSWSASFKRTEAIRDHRERQDQRDRVWSIVHDNSMSIAEKTLRLAALGVKV